MRINKDILEIIVKNYPQMIASEDEKGNKTQA